MMTADNPPDWEDLARRYDAQVLREYLLEQEEVHDITPFAREPRRNGGGAAAASAAQAAPVTSPEVHELRPRCFRRLRFLLVLNFLAYWAAVAYCGYCYYLRVADAGVKALPQLEVFLLGFFVLGTQATVEVAASALLAAPARGTGDPSSNLFRSWDGAAWLAGLGARTAILLDFLCLPLMRQGSSLLFLLSGATFCFAIGIFVFGVQLRLLLGFFCASDNFSYDKPDLFFKGRDVHGMLEGPAIAAAQSNRRMDPDEEARTELRSDMLTPVNTIKVANFAHLCDLSMLHGVLARLYIPLSCQETQEFVVSVSSFSRCFCEDVVQCSAKFLFLMDCAANPLVIISLLISASQAIGNCLYASIASMDIPNEEEVNE